MTHSQRKVINQLRKDIILNDGLGKRFVDGYEYKDFSVESTDYGKVILKSVVGMKDDKGTYASCLCRVHRQIFIGKRGGCVAYVTGKRTATKKLTGYSNVLIFGGER